MTVTAYSRDVATQQSLFMRSLEIGRPVVWIRLSGRLRGKSRLQG